MDILSHTLTGVATGTVVASFSKSSLPQKAVIILVSGLGGALPDFDAISLWSKFDATIGSVLNLSHTGKQIYFGKFWYSHHGALHSVILGILIPLITMFLYASVKAFYFKNTNTFKAVFTQNRLLILGFSAGFFFHLLEDMPTPYCVWGGVNFFFPSDAYIGGFGKIWWWNNYDIFLLIIAVICLNLIVLLFTQKQALIARWFTSFIFLAGLSLSIYQMQTRGFDFNYKGHTPKYQQYEQKSKKLQREILGEDLYKLMLRFDNTVPLNF